MQSQISEKFIQLTIECKFIVSFSLVITTCQSIAAQGTSMDVTPRITWVDQYPLLNSGKEAQVKKRRFVDFIFGKKNIPELTKPVNIVAMNKDDYWVLDQTSGVIFKIHQNVGDIPHIRNKQFNHFPSLVGFCFFSGNKMLFTDSYMNKILVFNPEEKEITFLNDSLTLGQPTGVAYSEVTHEIWVVETSTHSVSVLSDKGVRKKRIGSRGVGPGEFNFPTSIWIDHSGKVYIVDALNFRVQVFTKDGEFISVFGENGDGGGNFARPKGIATDSHGNIYIADALFHVIQVFDLEGKYLYNIGRQGHMAGEFWMPSGIFIDHDDNIFVADTYNSRIQIFQLVYANK